VFYGTMEGWLKAVDAGTGRELWKFKTASGIIGNPITYLEPDGTQHVAVLSGIGGWAGAGVALGISTDDPTAALGAIGAFGDFINMSNAGGVLTSFSLPPTRVLKLRTAHMRERVRLTVLTRRGAEVFLLPIGHPVDSILTMCSLPPNVSEDIGKADTSGTRSAWVIPRSQLIVARFRDTLFSRQWRRETNFVNLNRETPVPCPKRAGKR